jgi:CheY-like chemotaxis protein
MPLPRHPEPATDRYFVLRGQSVLIVSDNVVEAEAMALTIRSHGGSATMARRVADAEQSMAVPGGGFETVLIDAALETPDGATAAKLRAAAPGPCQSVILISPTDRGRLFQFRNAGYPAFLARPVRGATLIRVLTDGALDLSQSPIVHRLAPPRPQGRKAAVPGLRILIAEDNEINALLARAVLEKMGHAVEHVRDGRAAVEAVKTARSDERPDLVLMDLHMPVMDGLDAIALIRTFEEEKGLPALPIMVLSADSRESTRHKVLAHGATGFVTKPLDPQALLDAVHHQVAA